MAKIFPNNPVGVIAPEIMRIFRLLKRLPETYAIWMRMGAHNPDGPHFWIVRSDGRMLLLSVARASVSEVRQAQQASLFGTIALPGAAEQHAAQQFQSQLIGEYLSVAHLPAAVAFPSVPSADLERALPPVLAGMLRVGQDDLTTERLASWLEAHMGSVSTPAERLHVRRIFTPEVVVPAALTVRSPAARELSAGTTEYLLSYDQEWRLFRRSRDTARI